MSEKFKKGDRVGVVCLMESDIDACLELGKVGTVVRLCDYPQDCIVAFDGFTPADDFHEVDDGYLMAKDQLELVETEKLEKGEKGEPGCPPAAAPVYVLTNAELRR